MFTCKSDRTPPTAARNAVMIACAWERDELTRDLVSELQSGVAVETRAFLRPIFRWMKTGIRKNGQKQNEPIEKAFAFVHWMVQLTREGDVARGIPRLERLQPSYALNTIVTSSQRAGSLPEAQRAFDLLQEYGYEPDVFTYTALIDVIARNHDIRGAMKRYEEMRLTKSKPNIVTITTMIRSIGFTEDVEPSVCLTFLEHARAEEAFDEALYVDALDVCAIRQDIATARAVLQQVAVHAMALRDSERLVRVLAKFFRPRDDRAEVTAAWLKEGLVTQTEVDAMESAGTSSTNCNGSKTLGCLGNQTSDTVRLAVVQHDINRLVERIAENSAVSTNDFETLIHQCRKRKWKEEIPVIINAMRTIAATGWTLPATNDRGEVVVPPQPHLLPTSKTYVSIVDAYLVCGDEELAWQAFQEVGAREELEREQPLYRKFVRGCYLLTVTTHIKEVIELALSDGIVFTNRMCVELARMHGYRHEEGIEIVAGKLPVSSQEKRQHYMEELVLSCAYKHNTDGVNGTIDAMQRLGFRRSARTELAAFFCCLQHPQLEPAMEMLHSFQRRAHMLTIPSYESLLRELYFKYTRRGGSFDESSRATAMRTLQLRRALFDHAFRDRDALEKAPAPQGEDNEAALRYWCVMHVIDCAPMMFAQHVVEAITTIRDKDSKIATQAMLRDALLSTPDPLLFNLRAVTALRLLDVAYRGQAKLAKQMLALLPVKSASATEEDGGIVEIQAHHIRFCMRQLPSLTVHIVKELDDVLALHQHDLNGMLAFCAAALEKDNVDKTIGFIVSKDALYTLDSALMLMPKLAELYVVQGVVTILQLFKPEVEHSMTIRRQFLREVLEVERLRQDSDDDNNDDDDDQQPTLPLTRRAVIEFKLQHELEFMPLVTRTAGDFEFGRPRKEVVLPEGVSFLKLPLAPSQVVIVDQDDTVALAYDVLMHSGRTTRVGIDAEWRPDTRGYAQSRCSVLQIACETHVFLFDLLELATSDVEELFAFVFGSDTVLKLGFALDGDIRRLQWSFPDVSCFDSVVNVMDFAHDDLPADRAALDALPTHEERERRALELRAARTRRRHRGLAALVLERLGSALDKRQQRSDWERRPLSDAQIEYAALDAYCLILLHDSLQRTHA